MQTGNSLTLEQLIANGSVPSVYSLAEDLFKTLETAYAEKRWLVDICEKDILSARDGRFLLTASSVAYDVLPDPAIYANKDYWMPVFSYLIGRVRLAELKPGELPGILYNYLQAMLLILRVKLVFVEQEGYYNSNALFDQLPIILDKMVPEFRLLFSHLLDRGNKTPGPVDLWEIRSLFFEKVVIGPSEPGWGQPEMGMLPAWSQHVMEKMKPIRKPRLPRLPLFSRLVNAFL